MARTVTAPRSRPDPEELRAGRFTPRKRLEQGIFYTPAPLVQATLELAAPHVLGRPGAVIDPACGAGAFLAAAAQRFPASALLGAELEGSAARACRARVQAEVIVGSFLSDGWERLVRRLPASGTELWIGNPPYNGTSPLLRDPERYQALLARIAPDLELAKGQSLRDDFCFFLLLVAGRLQARPGLMAFITPTTILDSFLYAPVRRRLLSQLSLLEVAEVGPGAFHNAQVSTCITVWGSRGLSRSAARHRQRQAGAEDVRWSLATVLKPLEPELLLRPSPPEAAELHERWAAQGEPLTTLIPIHFPGLKTRFDELLVDEDPQRLLDRVAGFLACPRSRLTRFAREHGIPNTLLGKLQALHNQARGVQPSAQNVRPFFRYAGARHRGAIPASARAFCYLDRRLIPRGDHRMQGAYDPHAFPFKLAFNTLELPLCAAILDQPGCLHAHRHSRFAPLLVPEGVLRHGPAIARSTSELGPRVPNLSPAGLRVAQGIGGPESFFRWICSFINSPEVQQIWAPAFGKTRALPVPLAELARR